MLPRGPTGPQQMLVCLQPAPEDSPLEFSGLANGKHSPRCFSELLLAQNFIRLSGVASPLDRAELLEGRLPGAALPFVLVPMVATFSIDNAAFTRMLKNFLGIPGHPLPR